MANGVAKKWVPAPRWIGHALVVGTIVMAGLVLWCYLATREAPLFRKYFEGDLVDRNDGRFPVVLWVLLYWPGFTLLSAGLLAFGWLPFHKRFPDKLLMFWAAVLTVTFLASPFVVWIVFVVGVANGRWSN